MNYAAIQFSLANNSLDIFLSGCKGINGSHCKGCHNKELWDFSYGSKVDDDFWMKVHELCKAPLVKNIFIVGGEPFDQDQEEFEEMLKHLAYEALPIWVFTRYELKDVPTGILKYIDYIKSGPYDENYLGSHKSYGVELATTNQKIYKVSKDNYFIAENGEII